jgi:hypothetical protein
MAKYFDMNSFLAEQEALPVVFNSGCTGLGKEMDSQNDGHNVSRCFASSHACGRPCPNASSGGGIVAASRRSPSPQASCLSISWRPLILRPFARSASHLPLSLLPAPLHSDGVHDFRLTNSRGGGRVSSRCALSLPRTRIPLFITLSLRARGESPSSSTPLSPHPCLCTSRFAQPSSLFNPVASLLSRATPQTTSPRGTALAPSFARVRCVLLVRGGRRSSVPHTL